LAGLEVVLSYPKPFIAQFFGILCLFEHFVVKLFVRPQVLIVVS
jgi:hypothetical protein